MLHIMDTLHLVRRMQSKRRWLVPAVVVVFCIVGCSSEGPSTIQADTSLTTPTVMMPASPPPPPPPPIPPVCPETAVCEMPHYVDFEVRGYVWTELVRQFETYTSLTSGQIDNRVATILNDARGRLPWWNPDAVRPGTRLMLREYGTVLEPYPLRDASHYFHILIDRVEAASSPEAKEGEIIAVSCMAARELIIKTPDVSNPDPGMTTYGEFALMSGRYLEDLIVRKQVTYKSLKDATRHMSADACR